ncbi:MAG: UvrD-helicase domain-containing protein [Sandaracinaceae bacterium]|nr:UvrD-helicase domain-containing protein [Sandaracinaceae bacterium]
MSHGTPHDSPKLNRSQEEAVHHVKGPLLVLAGAGSGKTRVITHRIARLVEVHRVAPQRILAVSFTNKAAEEMGERMEPLVGKERSKKLWLSTFHSFGVRFLSEEAGAAFGASGKTRFSIFDQADCVGLLREIMKREGLHPSGGQGKGAERKLDLWSVHARISLWKNKGLGPAQIKQSDVEYDEVARQAYPHYEAALRAMRAFDFDDLVSVPARILREREDIRERWRERFEHLLVDEFQDTNAIQLELVKLLVNEQRNVCVVGDDDQSIYGWRGAEVGNILAFESIFGGAKIVKLEENYRSRSAILTVANEAIARSKGKRFDKRLRATKVGGDNVRLCVIGDAEQEAKFIAKEIRDLVKSGHRYKDVAVLYRSNLQARLVEEELRVEGIPYRLVGGTQFFDRKEVKDALAYLRAAIQPKDELALRRIVNTPARGIGETTIARVERWALAKHVPFTKAILEPTHIPDVPDAAIRGAHQLKRALDAARERFDEAEALGRPDPERPRLPPIALSLFDESGLKRDLAETGTEAERQARWGNVEFVLRSLDRYERAVAKDGEQADLGKFLQRLSIRRDDDEEETGNEVTLSSLHSAKGLEWPVVFLIGLNEGTLPHLRTIDPKVSEAAPTDVEEERRLFYVGVTRARERLYLTRFLRRELRGKNQETVPSRFLEGLPEAVIDKYERDDDAPAKVEEAAAFGAALLAQLRARK